MNQFYLELHVSPVIIRISIFWLWHGAEIHTFDILHLCLSLYMRVGACATYSKVFLPFICTNIDFFFSSERAATAASNAKCFLYSSFPRLLFTFIFHFLHLWQKYCEANSPKPSQTPLLPSPPCPALLQSKCHNVLRRIQSQTQT